METILSHRWVLGSIQAIVLAPFLELGRRVWLTDAAYTSPTLAPI